MTDWQAAQAWEQSWWASCINTYGEEEKQLLYANRMGLMPFHDGKSPYNFDMGDRLIMDIGGGPCSLLLKCVNVRGWITEPLVKKFPEWVRLRYWTADLRFAENVGEKEIGLSLDEAWIYNVLQHVQDPALIIANARKAAKLIRIFEWLDTPVNEGHLHTLTEAKLNEWLGGEGKVEVLTGQANCVGKCYYGVFPT